MSAQPSLIDHLLLGYLAYFLGAMITQLAPVEGGRGRNYRYNPTGSWGNNVRESDHAAPTLMGLH